MKIQQDVLGKVNRVKENRKREKDVNCKLIDYYFNYYFHGACLQVNQISTTAYTKYTSIYYIYFNYLQKTAIAVY